MEERSGAGASEDPIPADFEDAEAGPALPSASLAARAAPVGSISRPPSSYREIWRLAWPVMLAQVLLNVVSLVDIAMVGRLGSTAVAAVGYATQLFFLSQSVLFAVGFACVALMARAIGAGERDAARRALAASLLVSIAAALALNGIMIGGAEPIVGLLGAEPDVVTATLPYLRLVLVSSALLAVSMTLESGFRADRDTSTPMLIAAAVTALKIALNALLIFGLGGFPRLELVGAGLATLVSQVLGLLLFAGAIARAPAASPLRLRGADFSKSRPLLRDVVRLTLPSVGERLANNLALLAYFRVLSEFGTLAIAAYTVGVRLLSFTWIPGTALGTAAATLVGQALGAGDRSGAAGAGWRSTRSAIVVAVILGAACASMPEALAELFTDDAALVEELVPFLVCLALVQPALQAHFTLGGAHRGAGDTWTPFVAASVGNWILRVPLAFACAYWLRADVLWVWLIIIADHVARAVWLAASFRRGGWDARLD